MKNIKWCPIVLFKWRDGIYLISLLQMCNVVCSLSAVLALRVDGGRGAILYHTSAQQHISFIQCGPDNRVDKSYDMRHLSKLACCNIFDVESTISEKCVCAPVQPFHISWLKICVY